MENLHEPVDANGDGVVLTHGAGGNCHSKLLVAVAERLCASGYVVVRYDLPFRRARPHGPPMPATAAADRAGLREAALWMRERVKGRVLLGGHSYGGRQSTMLLAENPDAVDGLLLLSYPLHPPRKPEQLRTAHFPALRTPALFVHGTRDPFGSPEEMRAALDLIPGRTVLSEVQGAGHDLAGGKFDIASRLIEPLDELPVTA